MVAYDLRLMMGVMIDETNHGVDQNLPNRGPLLTVVDDFLKRFL